VAITLYGIKNCDTMKKARAGWMSMVSATIPRLQDSWYWRRKQLQRWCKELGWETLLNRAGTTFRKLPDADKIF